MRRPGCTGFVTGGKPVPSHAEHLYSTGFELFIEPLSYDQFRIRSAGACGFAINPIFTIRPQPSCDLSGWSQAKAVADSTQRRFFHSGISMDYGAFTDDSIAMMYEAVRGALATDDALELQGQETRFRVRETPEWKKHAADLEAEMLSRGMMFNVIDWHEGQAALPFED